uniref:Uncharacterized protein LOC111109811 n=1 Tax=Crassostrea virginica TaxID=6565 RepID=A0A8B8BEV8_CRAVI|nr:uncharacterized protein LOC111109811 [Crassostrea virginica]
MATGPLLVLILSIAASAASPVKRNGGVQGIGAFPVSRDQIEEAFRILPKSTIREFVKQLNANIKDAVAMAEKMRKIKEPIREDMSPDPALMKESGFLMEDASEMSDVFHVLPPLKEEDMHFLQTCIARAQETDFDQFPDKRSLMNEVLRQVFSCAAIGINLLESETNLDHLTDEQLTVDEVVNMFEKVQQMSIEFLHLGGFLFKFTKRVGNDFGNVSNNDLVHGKGQNENQVTNDYRPISEQVTYDSRPISEQVTKTPTVSAQQREMEDEDKKLNDAVQELKRLFDSGKLKGIKNKIKGKIPDKIVSLVSGKKKSEKAKDSNEGKERPAENKTEEKGTTKKTGKLTSLKNKLKSLFDRKSLENVNDNDGGNAGKDKTNRNPNGGNAGEGRLDDGELDKRQLLELLDIFAKRREVLKRENII